MRNWRLDPAVQDHIEASWAALERSRRVILEAERLIAWWPWRSNMRPPEASTDPAPRN